MTTRPITNPWKPKVYQVLIVLVLMQLFIALLTNGFALSADEAMWHYIGRNWFRNGLAPYTGGVDNKSPLIFAVFGLSDRLFGVNYWFPRVFGTLCQTVGIYYIYKIANYFHGRQAGMLAMSFYGLSVMWHGADGRYTSYSETYEVMFMIMAFYYALTAESKKGYFISGVLAAVALGFRLSAFLGIAALLFASARKSIKAILLLIAGLVSGLAALALLGWLAGVNLHDVYVFAFADNFGKGSTTDHDFWWRTVQFFNMFFYSEIILFYPLVVAWFFTKNKAGWLAWWLIFTFIGINLLGNYARVDMKEMLPPLSLMAAFMVVCANSIYKVQLKYLLTVIWICFSPKIVEPFVNFQRLFTGEFQFAQNYCHAPYIMPDESASRQLGQWVKTHTKITDKVLVAGYGTQVQAYCERISPSIYFCATQTDLAKKRFYQDLQHTKPDMVLVPLFPEYQVYIGADLRSYIDQLVAKDYYLETCMFNYNVYRRRK